MPDYLAIYTLQLRTMDYDSRGMKREGVMPHVETQRFSAGDDLSARNIAWDRKKGLLDETRAGCGIIGVRLDSLEEIRSVPLK